MEKALFLDRDGVINTDHGYVYKINNFDFIDGIFDVCKKAVDKGYLIFVITNQSGIARGYYNVEDFEVLTDWMIRQFKNNHITIKEVFYCPHHYEKGINDYKIKCKCRKPEIGMLLKAQQKYQLDLSNSIFIGDKITDMQAAESAGIKNKILIDSSYQRENDIHKNNIRINKVSKLSLAAQFII